MRTHVTVIAEAGVNHNGDLDRALRMVDVAKEAGADYIKFQTFKAENLVTKAAKQASYQIKNMGEEVSQYQMLKDIELNHEQHLKINEYCKSIGIKFFSTAFDLDSVKFLQPFEFDVWKIPSGEITNLPYLELIASYKKPVIISTGMATMEEIRQAKEVFETYLLSDQITILHCNTDYPTNMLDVNLRAMKTIQDTFKTQIGYSDHTLGIEVPIAAVALGATVIEKHFTLDRKLPGPDHLASLEPHELKQMVRSIRNIEEALGREKKAPTESEKKNLTVARKSIVAARSIKAGEIFTAENLATKRPGTGISPMKWHEVIGTRAEKNYEEDELI